MSRFALPHQLVGLLVFSYLLFPTTCYTRCIFDSLVVLVTAITDCRSFIITLLLFLIVIHCIRDRRRPLMPKRRCSSPTDPTAVMATHRSIFVIFNLATTASFVSFLDKSRFCDTACIFYSEYLFCWRVCMQTLWTNNRYSYDSLK